VNELGTAAEVVELDEVVDEEVVEAEVVETDDETLEEDELVNEVDDDEEVDVVLLDEEEKDEVVEDDDADFDNNRYEPVRATIKITTITTTIMALLIPNLGSIFLNQNTSEVPIRTNIPV